MSKKKKNNIIVPDDIFKGPPIWVDILLLFIAPPVSSIAGLFFLVQRGRYEADKRRKNDYRHYAAIIGDRSSVSIRELASRLGKDPNAVADDIQTMINKGMIDARAYIDRSTMMLYMYDDDTVETEFVNPTVNIYVNHQQKASGSDAIETEFVEEARPKAQPAKPAQSEEAPRRKPPEPRRTGMDSEDFEEKLREIRRLNDEIDNELVSERIDRIGTLTASIFRVVREQPEHADEVRKFMNYYLPTTLKLLKSYSLMEKQSYQGENIQASRKKIEDVLETLVHAFEHQQDKLFQAEALDVETDISVLETMMASDGLTQTGGNGLHL